MRSIRSRSSASRWSALLGVAHRAVVVTAGGLEPDHLAPRCNAAEFCAVITQESAFFCRRA